MENKLAVDLNGRLRQWRSRLENRPTIRQEDIEELESHLRDTMDVLLQDGLSQEEAFLVGAHRVGHPVALEDQFGCARPDLAWKVRAQWMVLGILSFWMVVNVVKVGTSLTLILGGSLSADGYVLGWAALAVQTLLILCFGWLAFRVSTNHRRKRSAEHPTNNRPLAARWIIGLSMGCVLSGLGGSFLEALAVYRTGPSVLALFIAVTMWGKWMVPAIIIGASLWLATSTNRKPLGGIAMVLLAGLLVGCNQSGSSANRSSSNQPATFEACLELINTDSDAAAQAFLDLNLTQAKLFSPGSALSYSESEFVNLPAATREKLGQQATAEVARIRPLAIEIRSRRDAARTAGDTTLAERYNAQLTKLGERLEGPDQLKLTQLVGRAVSRMASE